VESATYLEWCDYLRVTVSTGKDYETQERNIDPRKASGRKH